jgi:catechol-2,3-dioxygenase
MAIKKINHAVLYVSDANQSAKFYEDVFEMTQIHNLGSGAAIFMRMKNSENDHDLGLFSVGSTPSAPGRRPGLYHLAYEVETLGELVDLREKLLANNAYVGESDHVVSKSLYGHDPDGIEFEIMWATPKSEVADYNGAATKHLHLEDELAKFGADAKSGQ